MSAAAQQKVEPWRRRLYLPFYKIGEAARYAHISSQTVGRWHNSSGALSQREDRSELSYLQLIEVAVVAAFRKEGVPLKRVQEAREYFGKLLESEYPFAEYRFMTDGKELWVGYEQIAGDQHSDKLLNANRKGQLGWKAIIGRLKEFEYEDQGVAIRWHVAGDDSEIVIDPRVSFGAPTVNGTPTWVIKGRWDAGESVGDIAEDFGITDPLVKEALIFEGVKPDMSRRDLWAG